MRTPLTLSCLAALRPRSVSAVGVLVLYTEKRPSECMRTPSTVAGLSVRGVGVAAQRTTENSRGLALAGEAAQVRRESRAVAGRKQVAAGMEGSGRVVAARTRTRSWYRAEPRETVRAQVHGIGARAPTANLDVLRHLGLAHPGRSSRYSLVATPVLDTQSMHLVNSLLPEPDL